MGNCLVIQDRKEIRIMRVDGSNKVLEMPSPSSLKQVQGALAEPLLPGHGVLPAAKTAPAAVADQPGAVRVKLVISKQELRKMLDKEGMSLDDVVALMRQEAYDLVESDDQGCCGGWRPALESIPEGTGF